MLVIGILTLRAIHLIFFFLTVQTIWETIKTLLLAVCYPFTIRFLYCLMDNRQCTFSENQVTIALSLGSLIMSININFLETLKS